MEVPDFLNSKFGAGAAALLLLISLGFVGLNFFQGSAVGGADNIISYCGYPDYFDQFEDQNGYEPNAQCTDVRIADYRIDTEKTSWTNGDWGCGGSVSVYRVEENGDLTKLNDTGESQSDPEDITVGPLTVETLSQTSGLQFYNCDYVANTYEYDFGGNLEMTASTPEDVYKKDKILVTIEIENRYDSKIEGEAEVEFCSQGAFGLNRCVTRTATLDIQPGEQSSKTLTVPNENVGDVVDVSASFDGSLYVSGWQGANVDCDNDNKIERIEDCSGFPVTASKDIGDIRMQPPVNVQEITGPRTVSPNQEVTYSVNVSNIEAVSPELTWSNGETGQSATYSWNSTGNKTVAVTVDDGISERTEEITVKVETLFGGVSKFFGNLWSIVTFSG